MTDKEALLEAIEALHYCEALNRDADERKMQAITVIRKLWTEHAMQEPLEYWNAVEGWVKIDEVRKHFDSVGCGTIYKSAGEGRVPLCLAQPEQEPKIGCVNHDCDQCKAQPEQEPVAWPCLIDSADFSENTITLVMQCEDYKVSAGTHYLSTTPPKE